jgi:hypothetical protein
VVHEDPSTEATQKLPKERMFRKKSTVTSESYLANGYAFGIMWLLLYGGGVAMKVAVLLGAVLVTAGLMGFGYFSCGKIKNSRDLIEVQGLSEKVVRADIADACVTIKNRDDDLVRLYEKRVKDRALVTEYLKEVGFDDSEILGFMMNTRDESESVSVTTDGMTTKNRKVFFYGDDCVNIRTKHLEKIERLGSSIAQLSAKGVFVKYDYSYKLTGFQSLKVEMLKEAVENAKKSAEASIGPLGEKLGAVAYLRQGAIVISGEYESETVERWRSDEATSINKKVRLVMKAGFNKACSRCFSDCCCP